MGPAAARRPTINDPAFSPRRAPSSPTRQCRTALLVLTTAPRTERLRRAAALVHALRGRGRVGAAVLRDGRAAALAPTAGELLLHDYTLIILHFYTSILLVMVAQLLSLPL